MNKLSKRAWLTLGLTLALLGGLLVIVVRYSIYAPDWAAYRSVATAGSQSTAVSDYTVTDRSGTVVLTENSSGRSYHANVAVRSSMIHLLGDKYRWIDRVIFREYGDALSGYDRLSGVYHTKDGTGNLQLTVSAQVQAAAYNALAGRKGVIAVYNYKTGEILCSVSSPNYDPENPPVIDENADEYEAVYVNRVFNSVYIPGSTFKLVTAAAALENLEDIQTRSFHCDGSVVINGETIVCNSAHGDIGLQGAIARSCNVVFAQIAVELGGELLTEYAQQMGITSSYSFDGYTTAKGNINLENAGKQSVAWAGIGQYTDLINPCQYMVLMGAIANGGRAAKPYLVKEVTFGTSEEYAAKTKMTDRLLNEDTADTLASLMHYAVTNTYGEWNFSGLYAGAKSGTAEQGAGQTSDALLTGFVQDEDYPLAFVVIVEGGGYGSTTCCPIIRQVLDACVVAMDQES